DPLVSVSWLASRLGEPALAVVDCRFTLGDPDAGRRGYAQGHIPTAAFLDVARDLSAPPGPRGRHPPPALDDLERSLQRAGVGRRTRVVAYDERGEAGAARLWWLLRHTGHDAVSLLDGGLDAWRAG